MTSPDPLTRMCAFFLPLSLIALFAIRCSNQDPEGTNDAQKASTALSGTADTRNNMSTTPASETATTSSSSTNSTPTEERTNTAAELRGLRVVLIAELELVRARLNNGSHPDQQRDADQACASELAQGLDRADRALVAMDASTTDTWASIRESQMNEVAELREWMKKYSTNN